MDDFSLDLRNAEEHIEADDENGDPRNVGVTLGVLNGETSDEEWLGEIADDNVLFLAVEGDLNELASGFARDVTEADGTLMHFRKFLIVAPPGVEVDTDRL
ncbi:DUF5779 family protein [Halanaeroarchaeum sulfurireducens]|uniref:Uncharacterized protein n=1 Tax=Halanaeroarchaeum sulfurireducens TaxID=1604004 RepID=A0A0F7PFC4_9EURY|nr:DUF5779 family protein [Halanaeroarchaeum sulfurireducens]AKH98023.1 hypothetical protein HLASF_1544 [Halanaeroarchaeum sulfurireducens]ALG82417.1 hypothetical protein HLASA_1531 [Halanaeroarchaeum sulfurireducens]